jgi:hypothetical protein
MRPADFTCGMSACFAQAVCVLMMILLKSVSLLLTTRPGGPLPARRRSWPTSALSLCGQASKAHYSKCLYERPGHLMVVLTPCSPACRNDSPRHFPGAICASCARMEPPGQSWLQPAARRPGPRRRRRARRGAYRRPRSARAKSARAGRLCRRHQHGRTGRRRLRQRRADAGDDAQQAGQSRLGRPVPGRPAAEPAELPQEGARQALPAGFGNRRRPQGREIPDRDRHGQKIKLFFNTLVGDYLGEREIERPAAAAVDHRHRHRQRRAGGLSPGQPVARRCAPACRFPA